MNAGVLRRRRIGDWIGCCVFAAFAVVTLGQGAGVRVLLLPTVVYEMFIALSFVAREPARAVLHDLRARAVAHAGTFLMVVCFPLLRRLAPEWFQPTADTAMALSGWALWVGGSVFVAWAAWHLRSAFSIEPQARRLVTSGPYAFARHPLYTGYLLQYLGLWLHFPSLGFGLLLLAWGVLVRQRMRYEELVLSTAFPDYVEYRRRVGALGSLPMPRRVLETPGV